jgi:hypothetical protein
MYFCVSDHILDALIQRDVDITKQEVEVIYNEVLANIRDEALKKYLNRRLDSMRNQGRGVAALDAQQYFNDNV